MTEPTSRERDEAVDRLLRDAGARLRASAPDEATTATALEFLDDRGAGRRRISWLAPIVLAAAAASIVALVVTTQTDETVRDVPADTPAPTAATTVFAPTSAPTPTPTVTIGPAPAPATIAATTAAMTTVTATTSAPTTIASTTTTTVAPIVPAAFVGELPLDASAAVLGCPGTLGDLADAIPSGQWPIVSLACAGDAAVVAATGLDPPHYELTWTPAEGWTTVNSGTSHPCDAAGASPICTAFGDPEELFTVTLPLPPAEIVEDPNFLAGVDATDELIGLDLVVPGDAATFAARLGDELAAITPGDPIPRVATAVLDGVPVVTVTLSGIPDDSSSSVTYVVRYGDVDGGLAPVDGWSFARCSRGGGVASGLCV